MTLVTMRISMPDRAGMLAAVAAEISGAAADIVTIEVVHREEGLVVDNLCIDTGASSPSEIRRRVERVAHVVVEVVRAVDAPPSPVAALELAASLAALDGGPSDRLAALVHGLPGALGAEWAMALALDAAEELVLLQASARAPAPPAAKVPWLPLEGPRRLAVAPWMPTSWRLRSAVGGLEVAACPLGSPTAAVALARGNGRFRPPELRQLEILTGLAVEHGRAQARSAPAVV